MTQAQVLRADSEQVNGALKPQADGTKPLDGVIDTLANDVSVSYFLLPTPAVKEVERSPKDPPKKPPKDPPIKKPVKTIKKKSRDPMPKGLHGMESRAKNNTPICFSYNLGHCNYEKCSREHVYVGNHILKQNIVDYLQKEVEVSPSKNVCRRDLFQLSLQFQAVCIPEMVIHCL